MLKISRIGPCENNKSCRISFHESNKSGFAFFWIFYDFTRILQISTKVKHYRIRAKQLSPSAVGGGGTGKIPVSRPRSRRGKRWGPTRCSPRVDGWSEWGRRGCRRGGSTAAGGGCLGDSGWRWGGGCAGQRASLGCVIDPRECTRGLGLQRERPEEGVLRRRRQWRDGAGGGTREGRKGRLL
jgi:hypothetical protein